MKKRRLFKIGDCVLVCNIMRRDEQNNVIEWRKSYPFINQRLAQITGLCKRYDGHRQSEHNSFYDSFINYFVPAKTHTFWLVRFGLMNKEVPVSEEDIIPAPVHTAEDLPTIYPQPTMCEREKQTLREDSKHWPRDEKGRWTTGSYIH